MVMMMVLWEGEGFVKGGKGGGGGYYSCGRGRGRWGGVENGNRSVVGDFLG